jgi:hypothetical protein
MQNDFLFMSPIRNGKTKQHIHRKLILKYVNNIYLTVKDKRQFLGLFIVFK